jgi:hypothetical protein
MPIQTIATSHRMAPQFDRALRDLLRAAGCALVRQGRGSHEIWYSPITKLCRASRDSQPTHRQRHFAPGWLAKGVLNRRPYNLSVTKMDVRNKNSRVYRPGHPKLSA